MAHPFGERALVETPTAAMPAVSVSDTPILLDSYDGRVHVHWAPDEAVTPLGQLPFFIDYLKQAGLFTAFVADSPLRYVSPNAPKIRDILGTMVLSIVTGARRYAHINALRHDAVNPVLLGMKRICSDDSVLRGLGSLNGQEAQDWLRGHLDFASRPLLQEPWILDCDATVKPIYGHQEGAVVGYNPHKPGRPSHCYHTFLISALRLVLDVEVRPGNEHHGRHGLSGLLRILDGLASEERPYLVRGDGDYGNETVMRALEDRGQNYLFRQRMTKRTKELIAELAAQTGWKDAGQGWQASSSELLLQGWTRKRRVVVLRRRLVAGHGEAIVGQADADDGQPLLSFAELLPGQKKIWECRVLVTSLKCEELTLAQLYRDRADAENAFDELKNHWGWGGFVTHDLKRTQITARIVALVYNWWSLFVRLIDPETSREAITSRPLMLEGVARASRHAGQTTLKLTSSHSEALQLQPKLTAVAHFLRDVQSAPQLTSIERWCRILGRALSKFLAGKIPRPPPGFLPA